MKTIAYYVSGFILTGFLVFGFFETIVGLITENYLMQIAGCFMIIVPVLFGFLGALWKK